MVYQLPISIKGIVFEDNKVWLRKNERNTWELPGGKLESGEQPQETVKREILEELGFEVEVGDIVQSYVYHIEVAGESPKDVMVITYMCKLSKKIGEFELTTESGPADFEKFSLEEIKDLPMPEFYKVAIRRGFAKFK